MRIVLTADHAGVDLKDELAAWLREQGHEILDLGTNSHESVDYPRYGAMLAEALADGRAERGITVCGSAIGVAIAANRNPACRCAQVAEPLSATLARQHNDCQRDRSRRAPDRSRNGQGLRQRLSVDGFSGRPPPAPGRPTRPPSFARKLLDGQRCRR